MSLTFGALLHIQEEFILSCAQLMNARKLYNVPPPKRTMYFEVFMHKIRTNFSKLFQGV